MSGRVFHVIASEDWARAQASGVHAPPDLARFGFLHCCRESQLAFVLARHFAGRLGLLALEIDPARTGAELRWERSEPDQDSFPHLLGPLPVAAVVGVRELDPPA